jgi:hypothetical protein
MGICRYQDVGFYFIWSYHSLCMAQTKWPFQRVKSCFVLCFDIESTEFLGYSRLESIAYFWLLLCGRWCIHASCDVYGVKGMIEVLRAMNGPWRSFSRYFLYFVSLDN